MTPDELKIQLEARQDFLFLQSELRKYLEENSFSSTPEQRQRFLEDILDIVGDNVQIDGVDPDQLLSMDAVDEQVDAQLESRLEAVQLETDKLLVDIAEMRRTCPDSIRSRFALDVEDFERTMSGIGPYLSPDPLNIQADMEETVVEDLVSTLGRLKDLNQSIRELVAKLKRAQAVLSDAPSQEKAVGASKGTTNNVSNENLNEALNRQRRINRQHDLAAKLLAQK